MKKIKERFLPTGIVTAINDSQSLKIVYDISDSL